MVAPFQVLIAKEKSNPAYTSSLICLQAIVCLALALATALLLISGLHVIQPLKDKLLLILFLMIGFIMQDFFRKLLLALQKAKQAFCVDLVGGMLQIIWLIYSLYHQSLTLNSAFLIIAVTNVPSVL